jgi:hypothetical protein
VSSIQFISRCVNLYGDVDVCPLRGMVCGRILIMRKVWSTQARGYAVISRLSWELKPGTNQSQAGKGAWSSPEKRGQARIATTSRGLLHVAGIYQLRQGPLPYEVLCIGCSTASSEVHYLSCEVHGQTHAKRKNPACWDLPSQKRAASTPNNAW